MPGLYADAPAFWNDGNLRKSFSIISVYFSSENSISYYFRLDPSISDSKAGLFYSKLDGGNEFIPLEPTDLSIYSKDDTEHVGWFWQPYEAGKPVWMMPYYNRNNGIMMISYVVPMYFNEKFIGIVGMDFDYNVLDYYSEEHIKKGYRSTKRE